MCIFLILFTIAQALLLPQNLTITWTFSNTHVAFVLTHGKNNKGYIGIGLKDFYKDWNMDDSDLWIFDLENKLASDHLGEGSGFPEFDYENHLEDVKFSLNRIEWKRRRKTGDSEDIEVVMKKYLMLWCLGGIWRGEIMEHVSRGILAVDLSASWPYAAFGLMFSLVFY